MSVLVNPYILAAPAGSGLPLDAVQSIVLAAYSHQRRLFSSFAGIPYRMKNTTTNATADVVFTGDVVDLAQISAFSNGGQQVVAETMLYDQSGNGNDAKITGWVKLTDISVPAAAGFNCSDINYFSPPSALYSGRTAGAALYLFAGTWNVVAGHLSAQGSAPAHPNGLDAVWENFLSTNIYNLGSAGFSGSWAWRTYSIQHSGSQLLARMNEVQIGSGTSATFSTTLTNRKIRATRLLEAIYLSRAPTTDERELIAADMLWGYGLEAALPVGHTYKNAAPS